MNKQELVDQVAAATGHSNAAVAVALNAIIAVTSSEAVQLTGLGTFAAGARAACVGQNPVTGAEMRIAAAKTRGFTAGKAFKEAGNAG